jgi:DNA-binding NarL/FixJ family response regulator
MSDLVTVVIADDHPMIRQGLRLTLDGLPGIEVIGEATTGQQAVDLGESLQPDVLIMDINMPELNGIDATRALTRSSPHIKVLVLTMFDDDASVFQAMRAGARGYLLKGAGEQEIERAVRDVAGGQAIFGPAVAQRVLDYLTGTAPRQQPTAFPELSERERDVLTLLAQGRSNPDIARQLYLSPKTVRNHVSNIFTKLQVADRAQAIIKARDAGLGSAAERST